jgi:4-amino-4-deoxy-L-arabinose transferase-like glycosyltransferase
MKEKIMDFIRRYPLIIILLTATIMYVFWSWSPLGVVHSWNEAYYLERTNYVVNGGSYLDGSFDNPPFFVYTLSFLSKFTGINLVAFRFFTIFCTLVTVCVIYLIGATIKDKKTGLISSALYAFFPMNVIFSKIIQIEMFGIMLMALSFYFTILGTKNRKWFLLSGLFLGLTAFTKIPFALVFLPIFFYMIHKKTELKFFILMIVESILVVLPWAAYVLVTKPSFLNASSTSSKNFFGLGSMHVKGAPYQTVMIALAVLVFISLIIFFWKKKPKSAEEKALVIFAIVFSLFFVVLPNHEYYLLPVFVPLFLFLGILYSKKDKKIKTILISFLVISIIFLAAKPLYDVNWQEASDYIKNNYPDNINVSSTNPQVMSYLLSRNVTWLTRAEISTNNTILAFTFYDKITFDALDMNNFIEENFLLLKNFDNKIFIYRSKDLAETTK